MMKIRKYRIFPVIFSLILCVSLVCPSCTYAKETIKIYSEDDLQKLSKNCSLDSWSYNKTIELMADIELGQSLSEYLPIPIFSGTFKGNGHTISGYVITKSISESGFFGTINKGALVKELNIKGQVEPSGDAKTIAGIAGINYGTISGCTFEGQIKGDNTVGGIAGLNESTGKIINCSFMGSVMGEHYAGGIAGQNMGSIIQCSNRGDINTVAVDPKTELSDIGIDNLNSTDSMPASTDIGGIAGFSTGLIQNCLNSGNTGYEHIGYNIGGIVGRQSGYLDGCENTGTIKGRKDIGGIAGQMEPMIMLKYKDEVIDSLWDELDSLQEMIEDTLNNTDDSSDSLSLEFKKLIADIEDVKDNITGLSGAVKNWGNENIQEINDISSELSWTVSQIEPVLDSLSDTFSIADDAADKLVLAIENTQLAADIGEEAAAELRLSVADLKTALLHGEDSLKDLNEAMGLLRRSLGDNGEITNSLKNVDSALKELEKSFEEISKADEEILSAIGKIDQFPGDDAAKKEIEAAFKNLKTASDEIIKAISKTEEAVSELSKNSVSLLKEISQKLSSSTMNMILCMESLSEALTHFDNAADAIERAKPYADNSAKLLTETIETAQSALSALDNSVNKLKNIIGALSETPPAEFTPIDSNIIQWGDKFNDSISTMLEDFNSIEKKLSSSGDVLVEDLKKINSQIGVVVDVLELSVDEAKDIDDTDHFEDISDEKITDTSSGRITNSKNKGTVEGDMNTAGVVGSLAAEYDFDPEDDLNVDGNRTVNFRYETLAVVIGCTNEGDIYSKKDYTGGITGKMDLGSIRNCQSYGSVRSAGGDYVGGIAGYGSSTIKKCYAKCSLSGGRYIGGIIGSGEESCSVSKCYTLIEITDSNQYTGAVSGTKDGNFSNNYFVSDDLAGLGNISYKGKAAPVLFEELVKTEGIPKEMTSFTLRFVVEDKEIKSQSFEYGATFTEDVFPEIPAKEDCFAAWDTKELTSLHFDKTVNAVYSRYVLSLSSGEIRDSGRSIFMVDGNFDDNGELLLTAKEGEYENSLEEWQLSFSKDGLSSHKIRYLPIDENPRGINIYVKADGKWKKAECEIFGSYLTFFADNNTVDIAIEKAQADYYKWVPAAAAALLLIIILAAVLRNKRKKKKSRAKEKDEKEKDEKVKDTKKTKISPPKK